MIPRLLLDVDGVLNAWPYKAAPDAPWADYRQDKVRGFEISWSPAAVQYLLAVSERVEVLWLTTWEREAQYHLAPVLELPMWELAGTRNNPHDDYTSWWKLDIARQLYEQDGRPFIWIDDDIAYYNAAVSWMSSLPQGAGVAITPNSQWGLVPTHFDVIEFFLNVHSR